MKRSIKKIAILFLFAFFCFILLEGFDAHAASTKPVLIRLPVVQSFSSQDGQVISSSEKRIYKLTPLEKDNPMPSETIGGKYEMAITGNQTVEIGELMYTHAGIYSYQLAMVKSNQSSDYECDMTEYTIIVCVRNEENGQLGKPVVIIKNSNGHKSEILAYNYNYNYITNNEDDDNTTEGMPQTGDRSRIEIWILLFAPSALLIILLLLKRKNDFEQEE